ncbi:MAG: hypothetical protein KatS3mg031_2303 [Chitinophagales bacterium]|nr:MAG: hypothetical protein KatS3mg031_2303 [Chitinophagales bacterium]
MMSKRVGHLLLLSVVSFLLAIGTWNFFYAEQVDLFDGYGPDGLMYGGRNFINLEARIIKGNLKDLIYRRCLPMLVVRSGMRIAGVPVMPEKKYALGPGHFTCHNVLVAYKIYNFIIYLLIVAALVFLCHSLACSPLQTAACLILVLVNFANLKRFFLEPVSLDPSILLHAILLLAFYLRKNMLLLALTAIAGFAINEFNAYAGLLLCAFPFKPLPINSSSLSLKSFLSASVAGIIAAIAVYTYFLPFCPDPLESPPIRYLFPLSVALLAAFVFLAMFFLLRDLDLSSLLNPAALSTLQWRVLLPVLLIFIAYRVFSYFMAKEEWFVCQSSGPIRHLIAAIVYGAARPLGHVVAFTMYFGSSLILTAFFYRKFATRIHALGLPIFLLVLIGIPLALNTHSRQLMFYSVLLPAVLCPLINFKPWQVVALLFINLGLSKFWVKINPLGTDLFLEALKQGNRIALISPPLQKYYVNFGVWISDENYFFWLGITAAVGLFLALVFLFKQPQEQPVAAGVQMNEGKT